MRNCTLAVVAAFLAVNPSAAQTGDKEDLLKVEFLFTDAKLHNDIPALRRVLADDYIGFNQWGVKRDKKNALELFKSFQTTSLTSTDVSVHVSGDIATVDGIMNESGREKFLFVRTWVKRDGRWQLLVNIQSFQVDPVTMTVTEPGPASAPPKHPVTGRQIAGVMGMGGAADLVRSSRDKEDEPDKALAALEIAKGATVADIGAGAGYYSFRLAEIVGPAGKIYANDIQPGMIKLLNETAGKRSVTNVEAVLGKVDDPGLPNNAIDLALLVDSYHEFSQPQKMLDHIRESLKPGGRLVLIEYRKENSNGGDHKMTVADIKAEIEHQGYQFDKVLEILPKQHIVIFHK